MTTITPTNKFSIKRTISLLQKYVTENWRGLVLKTTLMYGLMILGALLVVWGMNEMYDMDYYINKDYYINNEYRTKDSGWSAMMVLFIGGLFVFGSLASSMAFSDFGNKQKRLGVLTFPALESEKLLARWCVYVPGFIVLFLLACIVAECVRYVSLIMIVDHSELVEFFSLNKMIFAVDGTLLNEYKLTAGGFLAVEAIFFLGSIVWAKGAYIKTSISVGVLGVAYSFIGFLTIASLGDFNNTVPAYSGETGRNVVLWLEVIVTLVAYGLAYWRYKDSEILNRW